MKPTNPIRIVCLGGIAALSLLSLSVWADIFSEIEHGNTVGLKELLDKDEKLINSRDKDSRTPLHVAAEIGETAMVDMLLRKGAQVDAMACNGRTPLHSAALADKPNIVSTLIARGANVNAKDVNQRTPLHLIAFRGRDADIYDFADGDGTALRANVAMLRLLIKKGADVNAKDKYGVTPLHFAAVNGWYDGSKILLEANASILEKMGSGETVLHAAALAGHPEIVRELLAKHADGDAKTLCGYTPLHCAFASTAKLDDVAKIVRQLVEHGANVNVKTKEGAAPLHMALMTHNKEAVTILIEHGADVNAKTTGGVTPIALASIWADSDRDMLDLLVAKGAKRE